MLTSLVRLPVPSEPSPVEDISSALSLIFTDDVQAQHGDLGSTVIYKSSAFGDIVLGLIDPVDEESRHRFGQYLWNSGILMGTMIGESVAGGELAAKGREPPWSVTGETILELGAGGLYGLAGIVSVLAGAKEVTMSDYPASEILVNIQQNVERNLSIDIRSQVAVQGHEWGDLADNFSQCHTNYFTRVLAADLFWMPWQHHNLARSMLHFLSLQENARVWMTAGVHTGWAELGLFFDVIVDLGLEVELIWERNVDGMERDWMAERDSSPEDISERNKWLVIAILRWRRHPS